MSDSSIFMQHLIRLRDSGMDFIHFVQRLDHPYFASFIKSLNYLDTKYFWLFFFPVIFMVFGRYYGKKIYFLFFLSGLSNHSLKAFFGLARPFLQDPTVGLIKIGGYGFPSGAAQSSVLLCALLITYWKNKWSIVVGIVFALMLSFSRVYLGVHYPLDIYAGWMVGAIIYMIYLTLFPIVEKLFQGASAMTTLVATVIILGLTYFFRSATIFYFSSIAIGLTFGTFFVNYYKIQFETKNLIVRVFIQVPICILGLFIINVLNAKMQFFPPVHDFFFLLLIGIWISYFAYYSSKIPDLFKKT